MLMRWFGSNRVTKGPSNAAFLPCPSIYHRKPREFQGLTMACFAGQNTASKSRASCTNAKRPRVLMLSWRCPLRSPWGPLLDSPAAGWPSSAAPHLNPSWHPPLATLVLTLPSQWLTTEAVLESLAQGESVRVSGIYLLRNAVKVRISSAQSFFPLYPVPFYFLLFKNTSLPKSLVTWCFGIHVLITSQLSCSERNTFLLFYSENRRPRTTVKWGWHA